MNKSLIQLNVFPPSLAGRIYLCKERCDGDRRSAVTGWTRELLNFFHGRIVGLDHALVGGLITSVGAGD